MAGFNNRLKLFDASARAFQLSDAIRGHAVRGALGASGARMAAVDPELVDLVRKEQDAGHQIKALKVILTDNLPSLTCDTFTAARTKPTGKV
jgi:hypothetical protein